MQDVQKQLVLDWMRKFHTLEYAHRYEFVRKERLNLALGVPVVILSCLIGAQLPTPWQNVLPTQVAISIAAILAAVLAALQTFFKPAEIAEKHRSASAIYKSFRHRLEFLIIFEAEDHDEAVRKVDRLNAEWSQLATPNVSANAWKDAKVKVSEVGTYPESLRLGEQVEK